MAFSNGFLLSLSLCLDIGLANLAMINLALQRGFTRGVWLGLGTCLGDLVYAVLALLGMGLLLRHEPVRWVLWLGGSAVLAYLCVRMLASAWRSHAPSAPDAPAPALSRAPALLLRGAALVLSSPSAILWFAAVGGAIIARQGEELAGALLFLGGFLCAGVLWTLCLCALAHQGGRLLGDRMLRLAAFASALIFAYFAGYVMLSGYREFVAPLAASAA